MAWKGEFMSKSLDIDRHEDRSRELFSFLETESIGSIGTTDGADPFLTIVFYVSESGSLFFKSRTGSGHSKHVARHPRSSFAVFHSGSTYEAKYGAQLIGRVCRVRDREKMNRVVQMYEQRFEGSGSKLPSIDELCGDAILSTFYEFQIDEFKIIDEDKTNNRTMLSYATLEI